MDFNDKTLNSKTLYKGHTLNLEVAKFENESGLVYEREIIDRRDAVAIIAMVGDKVVLVKQFRAPIKEPLLELPAGIVEDNDHEKTAYNELIEETGYKPSSLKFITKYHSSAGYTNEIVHIYEAADLEHVGARPEPEEFIEIVELPLKDAIEKVDKGEITDAKTIIGLLLFEKSSQWSKK